MIALDEPARVPVLSPALHQIVAACLPRHLRLDGIEVTFGTLFPGQPPRAKLVVHVQQVDRGVAAAPWLHRLSRRITAYWSRDEIYVEVRGRPGGCGSPPDLEGHGRGPTTPDAAGPNRT